ncbi:MAG: hypothetical protein ACI9ZM_003838 [Paracoccaceae bacterium]
MPSDNPHDLSVASTAHAEAPGRRSEIAVCVIIAGVLSDKKDLASFLPYSSAESVEIKVKIFLNQLFTLNKRY